MRRFVRPTLRFLAKRSGPEGLGNKRAVRRTIGLEMLEPRLLLSADVMPAAADLTITIDTASNAIVVLDNHNGGAELQRSSLTSRIPLVVTGTEGNDTFRIDIDPNLLPKNRIIVSGGLGDDTLVGPKGGSSWQLDKTGKGYLGNIAFGFIEQLEGSGSAQDTLAGPYGGAEWTLDGDGDGRVAGIGFANFDRLKGSDTGDDIFRVAPRGGSTTDQSLNSGFISIDGGLGSDRDRIIVEGNHFLSAHVIRTGSGIGTIEIDGMKIAHTGINNVHLGALDATQDVVQDYTFTAQSQDTITVGDDASDATLVSLTGSQAGDTTTFAKPTNSLTIVAPGEHAAVTLNSLTLPGIDLKVTAGLSRVVIDPTDDYRTTITVSDGSVVDTSSAEGAAGDITLQANTIDIGKNVMIDASGETGGNFTLTADSRRLTTTTVLEETGTFSARDAAISIDTGTTVNANSIDISALAGDETLNEIMGQYADGAPADLLKFLETVVNPSGIPISILVKRSAADIKITGANLNATGDVSIDANAQSIANGTGVFYRAPINIPGGLAFVYVEAEASATVTLDDTTSIRTTGGAISVTTEGTTTADGTARVSQNFARNNTSPTNPQNVQVAAAIGNVNLVSTIDLGAQTTLSAQTGKVTVMAQGNNSNEPGAETESYKDGLGGFTLGLALSNATVQVTALGTIESGSTGAEGFEAIVNPFKAVNAAADTIAVYSTAQYKTGDAVTYDTNSGGAIRGLTDGRIYYVIVADATHLQLAASRADALAGTAIDLGALPALEDAAGRQSGFSQVRESTGQIIFDYNPGFTVGQKVYYDAAAGLNIGGLQNKNTNDASTVYTVAAVTQSPDGYQWLVTLHDASGAPVTLSLDPLLTDINGIDYAFGLDGSALVFKTAQPGFATGLALTYTQALGFDIPTLADGTTYYLIKDPTDTTNTVFRLAASAADAAASDGFSNTVALGDVDTTATSNDEHTLTAINPGGVSITATLSTTEEAGTKSGQGGEPETSDLASKGEMLPMFGTMIKNVGYLATLPADQSGNLVNPMDQKIANNVPKGSNSNSNFGVAATVAFVKSSNDAKVQIGGTVQSKAGITVDASITHTIQTQAEGVKSPTQAGDTTLTIAGAATVGLSYDNAQIVVNPDTVMDASGAISMSATVSYPFIAPLDSPEAFGEYVLNQFESSPLTALSGFLGNAFLLKQDLVNSWARAVDNDSNADISIAGAVDFQHRNAFATIDVMGGAQINQNASYRSDTQGISLNAETELKMINVGGIFDYDLSPEGIIKSVRSGPSNSLQPFGAQGGKAAFGGAYRQLDLNSTTHAIIHGTDADGTATSIYTAPNGELSISAYNDVFVLGILQSGAESGQFGVSGSAAYTQQTADTVAAIEAGAVIEGGGVSVDAEDTTVMPTYVGDVIKGKNLGLGASIVYNDINRNTQAYVGAPTGVTPEGGDMNVTSLDVSAINSGRYIGIALAAAVADNDETAPGGTFSASAPNPNNPSINGPVNPSPAPAVGHYGVAVSGDVVFNQVSDTTLAVVNLDATLNVARYLSVSAENDTELLALTGSAAIAEGESSSAGLAGSYSENVFDATTLAEIRSDSGELTLVMGVNPYGSESVVVSAIQGGFATAVAAGGSGGINHADGSAEIAGSVAINRVTPATEAHLTGTSITTAGDIKVTAADAIPIYALAGAASFGGKQGIGASIALNITHNDSVGESVAAQIRDSRINQSGTGVLVVDARITDPSDQDRIVAVAGSLGQGSSVGVSGTVAMNDLGVPSGNAVEASITGSDVYASTDPSASVTVNAVLDQTLIAVGGEVALSTGKSSTFSLGAGVAYNQTDLPVQAFVESSNLTAQKLSITASIDGRMTATSAGLGVSTNGTGVAGSAGVNTVNDRVTAFIDGLSSTQSVDVDGATLVSASHGADFTAAAGELAAGTNSGGAAVSVNDIRTSTQAYIGVATVNGGGTVAVTADTTGEVTGVAVGAEGGQNFTLGASIAVNAVDTTTEAWVAGTDDTSGAATVVTPGSVNVAAQSDLSFITAAGTLAAAAQFFPGGGAVGVANATLLRTDRTQAWVRNSSVSFGGTNSPIDIKTASAGALQDDPDFTGLSVTAVSTDTITSASGGASIAPNENLAGAGSVTVTMVDKATQALVGDGVSLPSTNAVDVNVLAYDDTHVGSGAGALALLGQTGVGAGVDVVSLTKDTQALFAPEGDVTLSGGLSVQALSNEDLVSVALGASLLATTDIAGAASAYVLDLSTTAAIGDTDATDIIVGGSALLSAQDDTVLNQIPGGVSIGIDASVGAAVGVIDVKSKKVDAAIASGVSLTAHAGADRSAIEAATGEFAVGFVAPSGQNGDVPPPNVSIDTGKQTGDSNAPSIDNRNLHEERTAAPVFESTRGIAVSAINTGKFKSITFAVGGATTAAVDVDASVNVLKMDTTTRILPDVTLVSDGDVVLASGADLHKLGVTGSGAVSGTVSGAAGADVTLIDMTTKTEIAGGNTSIAAGADGDLIINAQAQEDILTITAGFAASAGVGLDVGATVIEVDNSTFAGVSSGVATMSAGGNVLVAAEDDTVTAAVTGDVAIGLTGGAFGGSTVVTLITKDTRAELFEGSAVDGLAHGTDTLVVPDGTYTGDNSGYNTKQLQGVAIQASSSEDVTGIAIGGGAGFYFGAGAAAVYTMIDSDTAAAVGANVAINQKSGASASQAVSITADNDAKAFTIGGGLGLGAVGIGAGVDVGKIHNDVDATIGSGSTVSATGEVDVFALGLNRLRSYALSAGAGAVGVDGSVSVWALGTGIESTYSDTQQSADALNYNKGGGGYSSAAASADGQTNRTDVTTLLGKYGNTGGANSGQVASLMAGSSTDYGAAQPNGAVQAAFADTSTSGVTAAIAQGAVIAAADLDVAAATTVVADQLAGGASVGIASVGASVSILNRGDTVQALMDGTVDVSGSIDVTAASFGYANSTAAGGTLGAVALGAQVAMVHDASAVSAFVGVEADIQRADQGLNVGAATVADLTGWAYGVDIGVVAGGVGVVDISSTGSTTAQLASASVSAAAVSVTADSTVTTNGTSDASAGGIGASAVGNVTTVTVSPQVSASIDSGTVAGRLDTPGDVEVAAYSSVNSTAMSNGYSLGIGLSAAASFATAVVDGSVEAYVGAGNTVNAGNVKVLADADETVVATSTANAGYTLIGSGEGTVATATITDTIAAYVKGDVTAAGDVTIQAQHLGTAAEASALGILGLGAVNVGYNYSYAELDSTVLAYVDQGTIATTNGGDITVQASEGADDDPTSAQATSTASQGVYAGGDNLASQAYVDQTATVLAFIGDAEAYLHDPDAPLATTAQIHADGDFTLNAESWTASNPEALTGPNAAFVADSAAYGSAVATKVTTTFIAGGAIVGAGGNADVTATSVESFTPLAAGSDGQGVNTNGTATTDVVLSRVTSVIVNGNASVDAQSITVAASSETHSSGSDILTDNQGQGAYNTTFHAGQGDSVSGKAASQSNFRIGLNTQSQSTPAATTVFIDGALTAPTIVVTARTLYDINVSSFAWVTAAAFGAQLSANTFMFTEDNVVVQFGDNASVDASSSLTLNAGFDPASVVSLYTKLHYSEDVQPLKSSTNAWTELDGLVALDNNDDQDAVTSPVIHASLDAALRPVVNWGFTVTDDNKRATYGPHDLTPNVSLDTRNDFASVASALEADPAAAVDASAVPNAPAAPAVNWGGAGNDWFVNPEATTAASGHRDGAIGSHQKEHRPSGKAYTTPFTAPRVNLPAGWGLRGSNAAQSAEAFQWAEPSGPAPRKIAADAAPKIFWTRN